MHNGAALLKASPSLQKETADGTDKAVLTTHQSTQD